MDLRWITIVSPYGGFGLKTKTSEAARRRIDGLLDRCAVEIVHDDLRLRVIEPASRALVEAMVGPLAPSTAAMSCGSLPLPADELVRAHGHARSAHADEAWSANGVPTSAGVIQSRRECFVSWEWRARGGDAAAAYDPWCRFVDRRQALAIDDYATALEVRGEWSFRIAGAGGAIAEPPYPASRVVGHLRGKHASAFLPLVFPHESLTQAMIEDFEHVCAGLGMKLPPRALRLSSPTRGPNRKLSKLS
jgi:hypothetical protein